MQAEQLLTFGSYRFDPHTGQLWRDKQEVRLTPKATTVLRYLVEHAGQVVTKEELFAVAWPATVVSDASLTTCVQEVRQALRDDARKPRYIETVHRRGFRFRPTVTTQPVQSPRSKVQSPNGEPTPNPQPPAPNFVGREAELTQLHGWLAKALNGERQIIFVTGEPGIGKTTLVEVFLSEVRSPASHEENQKATGKGQKAKMTNPQSLTPNP